MPGRKESSALVQEHKKGAVLIWFVLKIVVNALGGNKKESCFSNIP